MAGSGRGTCVGRIEHQGKGSGLDGRARALWRSQFRTSVVKGEVRVA
jgi:hypothetical protein